MHRAPDTRRQRTPIRVLVVMVATLAVIGSFLWQGPEPVAASSSDEAAFVAALNQIRADNGLAPFTVNTELANLARGHAQVMADAGEIFHANPISAGFTGAWQKLGENVGVGANVQVLVDAFVASSGHFANIIDPSFTQIGVGVVWKDSALYTTHRFLQTPGTAPTPTAPPTTVPAPPVTTSPPPPSTTPTPTPPSTTTAPTTTTTTIAPLPEPAVTAERVVALLEMLDQVGT
ncbi:MAG: CAP domain-containing protein [Acidimicrobiales bacterium]